MRSRKGECRDRLEHYRDELVRIMNCIKAENTSINALASIEGEVLAIQQENARVKAQIQSSLQVCVCVCVCVCGCHVCVCV